MTLSTPDNWAARISKQILSADPGKKPYIFVGSCVGMKGPDIDNMRNGAKDVSLKTLRLHCDTKAFEKALGYDPHDFALSKDWHIACYKSHYCGTPCYYIVHSAIEYVWVKDDSQAAKQAP